MWVALYVVIVMTFNCKSAHIRGLDAYVLADPAEKLLLDSLEG